VPPREPAAEAVNDMYRRISAEVPGMTVLPVLDEVCPGRRCVATVDRQVLRFDGVHFTPDGARWLIRRLEPALVPSNAR
jgi:lysophospholipase L1-like esterase